MKHKNLEAKTIFRFLLIGFVILALIFGIVFSSISASKGIKFGSQYRGSYQAMVGVYDVNKQRTDNDNALPDGDAKKAADVLQAKLSPFYDGSVTITINGNSRLLVTVPRDAYDNNSQLFVNAIQSTGGLFIFDQQYQDVMLDETLMTKAGLEWNREKKVATSELLGEVSQISMPVGGTNLPFLHFQLNNDSFKKMVAGEENGGEETPGPKLLMVSDTATVLNTIRNYFLFSNEANFNSYLDTYLKAVLIPLEDKINKTNPNQDGDTSILQDFFLIDTWRLNNDGTWSARTGSLLDKNFFNVNDGVEGLKTLLFPDSKAEHNFGFKYDISRYVYDSNAVGADFQSDGKYGKPIPIENGSATDPYITEVFNSLTKNLFDILLDKDKSTATNLAGIKESFRLDLFNEYFVYKNTVPGTPINTLAANPNISSGVNMGTILENGFYIGTRNYTQAKKAAALIGQTSSGLSFHVFSIISVDAMIANAMFIASTVVLAILIFILGVFVLFFYRLLGFYTIIIAAIIASLTVLMHVVFGIAMGPEIIAIMFILLALVMDFSVVFFEAIKTNIYRDKRPIGTAFKISNRETLGLVVDVTLATLLPNIILFWIGIGFLKNFATILTMGIIFVFLFEIVVLRLLVYFTARTSIFKKAPWLLPLDTSLNYRGRFATHYLIEFHRSHLDGYSQRSHLSTRDLIQIKKGQERIKALESKNQTFIARKSSVYEAKRKQKLDRWILREANYQQKLKNPAGRFQKIRLSFYNRQLNHLDYLIKITTKPTDSMAQIVNQRITTVSKNTGRVRAITLALISLLAILALIFSFSFGLNYSKHFGKGTQYNIYGRYIEETYDAIASPESIPGLDSGGDDPRINTIVNQLLAIHDDAQTEILNRHQINPGDEEALKYRHEWEALGVANAYKYLISNDYLAKIAPKVKGLAFRNPVYSWGADYSMIDPTTSSFVDQPWVSITITNNLIPNNNAVKDALQILAHDSSGTTKPLPPSNDGGVLGMALQPHTAIDQIKEIGIVFGILLAALLIYMIIRFKWTYYVALALSLILVMIGVIAAIVVFRVPFTIEALAGVLGALSFSLLTGMLFLGKGKSLIESRDQEMLNQSFAREIELEAQKKTLRRQFKKTIADFKIEQAAERKALDQTLPEYLRLNRELVKTQKQKLVAFIREQESLLKQELLAINHQIKIEAQNNKFLKEIFNEALRFGVLRTLFLGSFYLAISVVVAVTLPSIAILGFTLAIGVISTTLVMLTIMLPLWIRLESARLRWRLGYKRFINTIRVRSEEQVIKGLND